MYLACSCSFYQGQRANFRLFLQLFFAVPQILSPQVRDTPLHQGMSYIPSTQPNLPFQCKISTNFTKEMWQERMWSHLLVFFDWWLIFLTDDLSFCIFWLMTHIFLTDDSSFFLNDDSYFCLFWLMIHLFFDWWLIFFWLMTHLLILTDDSSFFLT